MTDQLKRKWAKQARAYRLPRARRLPWIRCRHCGWRLAQMDIKDGYTCLRFGRKLVFDAELKCPCCGTVRHFPSRKVI